MCFSATVSNSQITRIYKTVNYDFESKDKANSLPRTANIISRISVILVLPPSSLTVDGLILPVDGLIRPVAGLIRLVAGLICPVAGSSNYSNN